MRIKLSALLALGLPFATPAGDGSPIGRWKTLDDETGKVMTIAEVYRGQNGKLAAKIVEAVDPSTVVCSQCSGAKKDKPTVGMPILWNLTPIKGGWGNGEGYKPSQGRDFKARSVKLVDGGNRLEVTGCKLMFCKTATWLRVR